MNSMELKDRIRNISKERNVDFKNEMFSKDVII